MSALTKQCKYGCGKEIEFRGKEGTNSTGYFEVGTNTEHTYKRCKQLIAEQAGQAKLGEFQ